MACGSVNDVKKCVLHVDQKFANNDKGILLFTEESLAKCKKAQLVYENREKSKYKCVKLPTVLDGLSGYHVKCYSSYTSVSKEELAAVENNQKVIEDNIYIVETSQTPQSGKQTFCFVFSSISLYNDDLNYI